ncbi:MAG: methyltransferase [Candidatus Sumerlaeota bacterium]|nr:methyltransferase [Candidatus Sumerlaeota bacterium]
MTTSRERLQQTLNHQEPDRVCVDFGSTAVTGMHVRAVSRLRQAVLKDDSYRVKVIEPYQMLGEVDDALRQALEIDVAGILAPKTLFGFENKGWKPFELFDGTPVLVPEDFRVTTDKNGDLLIYPEGDLSAPPRGRMPKGFHFFDTIIYQEPIDEEGLNIEDNLEEFGPYSEKDLEYFQREAKRLMNETTCGVIATIPGAAFGDIALVPAPWLKRPKGIRDIQEWYLSTLARRDYVYAVFEEQCEIAVKNIERLARVVGRVVQAAFVTGTDFGTQHGCFISRDTYRDLFLPFHKRVNRCIHEKSNWKTFIHSCGSVIDLIPDFIEAGFDILNPVQTSAKGMDPKTLKKEFGQHLVFWGGGVDTQRVMEFGTPDDVYAQVRDRIEIFGAGGGFVFDAIHNVQATTPVPNMLAMFQAIKDSVKG